MTIGPSTQTSTKSKRSDVSPGGGQPASFRYNNPGAQYPSARAAKFGQIGYGIIGGNHKIARFPSPVNGAACNFDLLRRSYVGMSIGAAGKKWTGAHGFGILGYNSAVILTAAMVDDPKTAIPLLKAIAHRESGKGNNLTEHQWRQAHKMFQLGSADAFLATLSTPEIVQSTASGPTGAGLLARAREHIGEEYRNINIPKNDPDWKGPWDCAEFASWLVFQEAGFLYGCIDNDDDPAKVEAYTGAWKRDSQTLGTRISVEEAAGTVGAMLLRYPPSSGKMGHIAVSDGQGGTVEAKGRLYGVVADRVNGRSWDIGILIPGINYDSSASVSIRPPTSIYKQGAANMSPEIIVAIQSALAEKGFDPGMIDGEFGPKTEAAVIAYQQAEGLTIDGEVGPETSASLGIDLQEANWLTPTGSNDPSAPNGDNKNNRAGSSSEILLVLLSLLLKDKEMIENANKEFLGSEARNALLLTIFSALLSGKSIDLKDIIASLSGQTTPSIAVPAVPDEDKPNTPDPVVAALIALLNKDKQNPPEPVDDDLPVNNALGKSIGNLLNGRKTALGIIGSVITGIIGSAGSDSTIGQIAKTLPWLEGATGPALPIFLGILAWGGFGKLEKWSKQLRK